MTGKKRDGKLRDIDIRIAFIKSNLDFFKKNVFVNEMGINSKSIADIASLDFYKNILYGFEIKSEVDSLARLYKQMSQYTIFFNIVYVVGHHKHTKAILDMINSNIFTRNVGYIEVSQDLKFTELKTAKYISPRFDTFLRNLDMEELVALCENKGQYQGWEGKSLLVDKVKRSTSMEEVYEHLKNKVERYFCKKCPNCGSNLYYNKRDRTGKRCSFCYECGSKINDINIFD